MKNQDMPAMPCKVSPTQYEGLTKLEHFAGLAMQGLLVAYPDATKGDINDMAIDQAIDILKRIDLKEKQE